MAAAGTPTRRPGRRRWPELHTPAMTLADQDEPIPYLQRTRDWYLALGYGNPYRYAHFQEVPFQRLRKPLAECVVTLVTTAAPYQPDKGDPCLRSFLLECSKALEIEDGHGGSKEGVCRVYFRTPAREYSSFFAEFA